MNEPVVRKAVPDDGADVQKLILENWDDEDGHIARSLPLEFEDMFSGANYRPTFFVATWRHEIIGCSYWNWSWINYDTFELGWMCVGETHRRQGLGERLHRVRLRDIRGYCRTGRPQTFILSTGLVARYEKFGFRVVSPEPNLMVMTLSWEELRQC